jgi:hypothetical protein
LGQWYLSLPDQGAFLSVEYLVMRASFRCSYAYRRMQPSLAESGTVSRQARSQSIKEAQT